MVEEKYSSPEIESEREMVPSQAEIEELKARLERLETQLKKERVPVKKEEMVRNELKRYFQELQETPPFAQPLEVRDEAKEIKKFERSQQVGSLVSLAFEKGLPRAISVARALDDPAILDEFHDTLVDHYYQKLVEKKILKP